MNRNLVKLFIVLIIGFITILAFSSLSAQTKQISKEPVNHFIYIDEDNPADSLYDGSWHQDQIPYASRDSIRNMITDSLFHLALPLVGIGVGAFVNPWEGRVTSRFGPRRYRYHYGIDINLNTGDTLVAAFCGKVRMAKYHYGYGNMIVIRHHNGLETVYGHLSKMLVDTNQYVKAGDIIGLGGNTGRSYGSHLHFEIRYFGVPFNPEFVIDYEEWKLKSDTLVLTAETFHHLGGRSSGSSSSSSPGLAQYHKIRQGENLSVIAKRYGTSVNRLCQLNKISQTTTLQIGRSLRVR